MCNNQTNHTNYHYEARIRNQREYYIDKELMIQYVNELDGIREQTIPEFDLDRLEQLPDNALLKVKPELYYEWDFEKNGKLGYDIYKVTKGMEYKVWWICPDCGSNYFSAIDKRKAGGKCPYCRGLKVNHTNSLASIKPHLVFEFNTILNSKTTFEITSSSNGTYWWRCCEGHEWESTVNNRTSTNNNCPYCANQKLLIGYNDMWTTNPELAKLLANPEDGHKYTQCSGQKVDWKCSCGEILVNKKISEINKQGLSCIKCSDGYSYPEKIMYYLLKQLNVNFKFQKVFVWSQNRIYDFYISNANIIIETHGKQHYEESQGSWRRTLEEEQFNDKFKYELAFQNGILPENYIAIDCRKSDIEFIKNNIMNSRLAEVFDLSNIDWVTLDSCAQKSFYLKVIEMWNTKKYKTATELSKEIGISINIVTRYLNRGTKNKICIYDVKDIYKFRAKKARKAIVQLSINGEYIREFTYVKEVLDAQITGVTRRTSIVDCCLGNRNQYANFKWMYKEDYDKYIEQQNKAV